MLSAILFIVLAAVIGGIWGFIIGRPKRDGHRQPGVQSAEPGQVKGAHWPKGYRGIPRSEDRGDGDGAT